MSFINRNYVSRKMKYTAVSTYESVLGPMFYQRHLHTQKECAMNEKVKEKSRLHLVEKLSLKDKGKQRVLLRELAKHVAVWQERNGWGERERKYFGRVPHVLAALMTENKSVFSNSNEFNYDLPLARCLDQLMSGFINCQLKQNQVQAPNFSHFSLH